MRTRTPTGCDALPGGGGFTASPPAGHGTAIGTRLSLLAAPDAHHVLEPALDVQFCTRSGCGPPPGGGAQLRLRNESGKNDRAAGPASRLSVPETVRTGRDLLLRLRREAGMVRRWRCGRSI
jgi:hypothetical protein